MKSPVFRRLRLAAALFLLGYAAPLALAQDDLSGPQAEANAAAAQVKSADAAAKANMPNETVKAKEDALDKAAQKNADTPDNAPGKASAQAAEDAARATAEEVNNAFEKTTEMGKAYRKALEDRRAARKRLQKALDVLRKVLQKRRGSLRGDNSDVEHAIMEGQKVLEEATASPVRTVAGVMVPDQKPTLAALTATGKIQVETAGTGETIGHVADLRIRNLTDQPVSFTIPAMILESGSGKNQHYACPHPQTVDIGPKAGKTVPIDGVCLVRGKPAVGKGVTGDLLVTDGIPRTEKNPASHVPDADARDLIRTAKSYYDAAEKLQKEGALNGLPYADPQKQKDIVVQWGLWSDPEVAKKTDGKPATKEDLKKVVYKQLGEQGPLTPDTRKKVDQGINTIFEKVQLTSQKAKDLKKPDPFAGVEVTGTPGKGEQAPATDGKPPEQGAGSPKETPKSQDKPDPKGQANPLNPAGVIGGDGAGIVDDPDMQARIDAAKHAKEWVNRTQEKLKKAKDDYQKKKDEGIHHDPNAKKAEDQIKRLKELKKNPLAKAEDQKLFDGKIRENQADLDRITNGWRESDDGRKAGKELNKAEEEAHQAKEDYKPHQELDKYTEQLPQDKEDLPNPKEPPPDPKANPAPPKVSP